MPTLYGLSDSRESLARQVWAIGALRISRDANIRHARAAT